MGNQNKKGMPRKVEETKMEKHNPEAKSSIKRHKAKTRQKERAVEVPTK